MRTEDKSANRPDKPSGLENRSNANQPEAVNSLREMVVVVGLGGAGSRKILGDPKPAKSTSRHGPRTAASIHVACGQRQRTTKQALRALSNIDGWSMS